MKIAVACLGDQVAEHFGHCEGFAIYETIDDVIIAKGMTPNPGHKPGFLPNFLADMGVELIIAGGMGGGAVEIFKERNVRVITGAKGDCLNAVNAYCAGRLQSSGDVCHEHQHSHEDGH